MNIKSSWPKFSTEEIKTVSSIIKSGKVNYWTGEHGKKFEIEFSNYHNRKYSLAVTNGTVALELALKCFGFKENDEVITTPRSYYASSISIINANLKPVFADIDIYTQNISPISIEKLITKNTKCLLIVHLGGNPCEMDAIIKISKKYNLKLIEDCSQSHGSVYKNKKIGTFGDVSTWSFCNDKIISTLGEGGMISTNSNQLYKKLWSLKEIGKDFDKTYAIAKNQKIGFQWIHDHKGSNHRMTEVQSAVGRIQLKNLNKTLKKRINNAEIIINSIKDFKNIYYFKNSKNTKSSYYRFNLVIDNKKKKSKLRDKLLIEFSKIGILCRVGSCPEIYKEKIFKNIDYKPKCKLLNAELVGSNSLSFQVDQTISKTQMQLIANKIRKIFINYNI